MKLLYLLVDGAAVLLPLIFSFHPRIRFARYWKSFLLANLPVTAAFVAWDIWFTARGVWSFNPKYVSGIYLANLPLEEILFFICIPFSCVFTYYCLTRVFNAGRPGKFPPVPTAIISGLLLLLALVYPHRPYTFVTFITAAALTASLLFFYRIAWFGKFLKVYLVLLIPFFLVNGLLTGTGLPEPVVSYSPKGIMGIRALTIPAEDFVYGYLLILLNLLLFSHFAKSLFENPGSGVETDAQATF